MKASSSPSALNVPPYATPLNDAADKRQWWREHRPLFLQTGALGLIESRSNTRGSERPHPTFSGFRFLTVADSAIETIRYARLAELRQNALRMPWEPSPVITYDANRGIGVLSVAEGTGRLRRVAHYDGWRQDWSIVVRGDFGGRGLMDALFYSPATGTGEFWEFAADGSMRLLGRQTGWRHWTHIAPMHVRMGGVSGLLFYDQSDGAFDLFGTGEGGAMERLPFLPPRLDGASHLVPLDATGGLYSNLLSYDEKTGTATLHHTPFSGWRTNWTRIVPGRFGGDGRSDLLFYQASTGTGEFYAVNGAGGIDLIRTHTDWRGSWTHIVAGKFGGGQQSDLLFYEASTGTAEIWSVDQAGGIQRLDGLANWGPWTHVVA